jgi:hypothetical protein
MYHQQITEGNIILNIDMAWSEVACFQAGENLSLLDEVFSMINNDVQSRALEYKP